MNKKEQSSSTWSCRKKELRKKNTAVLRTLSVAPLISSLKTRVLSSMNTASYSTFYLLLCFDLFLHIWNLQAVLCVYI